ncbi:MULTISPECIES: MFS transporter [Enterobacterales]|uniref:MFS transporter n=1 Tax=Enterobacterales TaxID=91347 RepID=UPI000DFFA197|nr:MULTISPECIES: MFS transporter [Serratia]MDW5500043.1 MFS transporter [Serratia proteamaculans]MDW5505107.1 MFS transporter [Pseudomonas lundensis]SUI80740.1 Arabinose efflux permease [Serratia liquefaciens]
MLTILSDRTYRHLFLAQIIALVGTGLATVALGLLAYDLAGDRAGAVLGTALAVKMTAYIVVAPVAAAFAEKLPRRAMLVCLDLIRALVALALPFVTQIWEVYILIFILQSASAAFTPTFQATIPDILPRESDYTRALSLSRLAYDLESVISPMLAAALLTVMSFHSLFAGTVVGFLGSAALVVSVKLPQAQQVTVRRSIYERTTRGMRIFLRTPRLRGLLALNLAVASASAMVVVNTVVLVQAGFGLSQKSTAIALAFFGLGSMISALVLPRLLDKIRDRTPMLIGAGMLAAGLAAGIFLKDFATLLALWLFLGIGYSLAQTPSGRLLRRSSNATDRPALFAAQFALSHSCWLITYPLAGWLGATISIQASFIALTLVAVISLGLALTIWRPEHEESIVSHIHHDKDGETEQEHRHEFVIDDEHPTWPKPKK